MTFLMDHPFPKSTTAAEKARRLMEVAKPDDVLAILINADPDAMASALALKRLVWRRTRETLIYHVNTIQRADNLAFIRLLKIELKHIQKLRPAYITLWATVDSQPVHHEGFGDRQFDIIIDHHTVAPTSKARFVDIHEDYGATSTIMTEYLRVAKIKPSPRIATALFYGIKTDTDDFVRESLPNDINALRYLYRFTNMNIIKKIESSEITQGTLASYRLAMDRLRLLNDIAFVNMGVVDNPDILVIIADFFIRLAEATWSVVTGTYENKLIVILRNAGFRGDAGKSAKRLFGHWGASAGGHKHAARAEIPLAGISKNSRKGKTDLGQFVWERLKDL